MVNEALKTPTKPKSTTSVSISTAEHSRARMLLPALLKQPQYKHLRLKTSDVINMALGVGLDALAKNAPA